MMFRSTRAEEDSGSDWDDLSPHPSPPRDKRAPHKATPGVLPGGPSHSQTVPRSSPRRATGVLPGGPSHSQTVPRSSPRRARTTKPPNHFGQTEEPQFTMLASPHPPPTPTITNSIYRVSQDEGTQTDPLPSPSHPSPSHSHISLEDGGDKDSSGVCEFHSVSESAAHRLLSSHNPPPSLMGKVASRSEQLSRRCAAEVFSAMRVVTDFLLAFLLEGLHFCLSHLLRKLCCGLISILSDALCKPSLTAGFNGCVWPLCSCLWHCGRAFHLCLSPCLEVLKVVVSQCALLCRSCRLVEVNIGSTSSQA